MPFDTIYLVGKMTNGKWQSDRMSNVLLVWRIYDVILSIGSSAWSKRRKKSQNS